MKKIGIKKFIPVGIGLLSLSAFVGSISGSLAWWAYSTRVSVTYEGTTVSTSEQLQIGLKLNNFNDTQVQALTDLGLEEDTDLASGNDRFVFSKAGGGLPAEAIRIYLQAQNIYSYNELCPVTSRTYEEGQALTLYETLLFQNSVNTVQALRSKYTYIPFVFRIIKLNAVTQDDKFAEGRDIYLSKAIVELDTRNADSKIGNGLRIHFNNGDVADNFILNPLSTIENEANMYTPVCGLLDLNNDKVFDAYAPGHALANQEIIYGDYTGTPTNTFVQSETPTQLSNINEMDLPDDFDYTKIEENRNTFLAAHGKGYTCLNDYSGITKGVAKFKTLASIKPDDSQAQLSGGLPLCTTAGESGNYLAELNLTIWLEGWDHAVIDNAISHKFNLGLQFQIDLVR